MTASTSPGSTPGPTSRLRAERIRLAYGERVVVGGGGGLDLAVPDGALTVVVGPNGCGKSTVLRALGRLMRPTAGRVLLDGRAIDSMPTRAVAQQLALLPQSPTAPEGLTVRDLVARGRHPHQRWFSTASAADEDAVARALGRVGMLDLADRVVDELSGGQRQRAWIALALAQETDLLLLDEPTTYLDLNHQLEVLDLVHELVHPSGAGGAEGGEGAEGSGGRTAVAVLHDLNLTARYADHVVAVKEGAVVAAGTPAEVFTEELLEQVFSVRARVLEDPVAGGPLIVPLAGRHATAAPQAHDDEQPSQPSQPGEPGQGPVLSVVQETRPAPSTASSTAPPTGPQHSHPSTPVTSGAPR
ncbi:ABC transporter ATP-binding protein [Quadrisphaera setariae]|uniref:ABC transporter ATP-binding protein n=1 Tax=Quadrisphaera setariae TaxID=2593304 RepID=A0A5C8ZHM2_9ACTN|nr:ABC transporter ATP-binding protein [Quadrisphaera setariae]TXR56671.1 ABC transporter ATP-binding protein [Quadrisphaera setariae]